MAETFISVARVEDLPPGSMARAEHAGQFYLLANVDGTVYAIDDECSHEDASLYKGSLRGDCVACPLHGSRFKLSTGEPLEDPAYLPVNTYPVRIEDGAILIGIGTAE